jgi:hypothetical protein
MPRQITNPNGQVIKHRKTIRTELLPRRFASRPTHIKLTTTAINNSVTEIAGTSASFI